mmetsp:Transcript_35362/g.114507  ORF Transcript_35362/g.114507 Transcript_35362/m.114507 type:complete len:300 (-) Transcript_35362:545-1444(-)
MQTVEVGEATFPIGLVVSSATPLASTLSTTSPLALGVSCNVCFVANASDIGGGGGGVFGVDLVAAGSGGGGGGVLGVDLVAGSSERFFSLALTSCFLLLDNSAAMRSRAGIDLASVEGRVLLLFPPSWRFATSSLGCVTTSARCGTLLVLLLVCFFSNCSLDSSPMLACEGDLLQLLPSVCATVWFLRLPWPFGAFFFVFTTAPVLDDAAVLRLPVSAPCGDMLLCDDLSLSLAACAFNSSLSSSSARAPNEFVALTFADARPLDMEFCVKETFGCAERGGLLASAFNCSSSISPYRKL